MGQLLHNTTGSLGAIGDREDNQPGLDQELDG